MKPFFTVMAFFLSFMVNGQFLNEKITASRSAQKQNSANFYQNSKMNYYDIKHLLLDITVQPKSTFISANCNYTIQVTQSLDTFAIEFKQTMQLDSVYLNHVKTSFTRADDHIYIPLQPGTTTGATLDISFFYQGNVAAGFFSGTDANGLDFTANVSESFQAREWFPAKQLLNDKIDSSDIWITTGAAFKAGSNGLLKAVIDLPNDMKQYRWSCHYPLSYYMPSVAVGNYMEYDVYAKPAAIAPDSILVQNFLYNNASYFNQVKYQLDKTPRFIEKMSELFGIYPFYKEKYGHSQADIGGGMEHATMTTLSIFEEQLVAHELGHQWFGDNVTCASWSDVWLNESFATYIQYLMVEKLPNLFTSTAADVMTGFHNRAFDAGGSPTNSSVYVPTASAFIESRIFNYDLTYAKGATALHNLRFEMQSDTLFFNTLKKYQKQFAGSFANTENLRSVAEQVSGKNFSDFFNQKIYGSGYPIYNVTYLKHGTDTLVLQINQTVSAPASTPFFNGLMEYKILSAAGDTIIKLNQTTNAQTFTIYYPKTPTGVVVDPNDWVLDSAGTITQGVSTMPLPPNHITVFPNPASDAITIQLPPNTYNVIRIVDVSGHVLSSHNIAAATTLFKQNLRLASGIYFLHFIGSKSVEVQKIMVTVK